MLWAIIAVVIVVALVAFVVVGFNKLRTTDIGAQEALGGIDVQLTRRADLIPNLVETVKGYAAHEQETLQAVTQARAGAQQATTPQQAAVAEGGLSQALGRLFAVAEAYPDLKADANFRQLQDELSEIEQELQGARRYYNATARDLNTRTQSFPDVLFARPLGFSEAEFYQDDDASIQHAPKVEFGAAKG